MITLSSYLKILPAFLISLTAFGVIFLNSVSADWPTARFDNHNSAAAPFSITELETIWTSQNHGLIIASPVVDRDGNIYLVSHTKGLVALDKNGNQRWTLNFQVNSSPVLDNTGNLYFVGGVCSDTIFSFDKNGQKRWHYAVKPDPSPCDTFHAGPIALSKDQTTLYSGVSYPSLTLLALHTSGTPKWQISLNGQGISSIGAADDETIYAGAGARGYLFALNPNGTIKWSGFTASGLTVRVLTPVLDSAGNIYVVASGSNPPTLVSFTPSGSQRWAIQASPITGFTTPPALKDQRLYLTEGANLKAVDTISETTLWQWNPGFPTLRYLSPPVVDKDGNVYVSLGDKLFVIDSNGQTKNTITIGNYAGWVVIPQDNLILITKNSSPEGYVIALGKKPLSKTPLILIPGIGASFNLGVLTDRGDTGWSWMRTAEGSWRQFIDSLEKAGYQKDKDYFIAFYDWRKTNDWTNPDPDAALPAKKYLVDAIDKAKTANPGINKVNVVAHSLGGLVIRSYVESSNYRGDINKAFLIGSPNAGSVFAYYTWEGAEIPPNLDPINKVGLNIMIRLLSFNFNEVPYLMIHNHIKSIKDLLPVGYNYIIKDETPLDWLNMQEVNNFLKNTSNPRDTAGIFANKGIGLMNITGTGQTTWEKIKVKDFLHQYLWKDGKPLGSAGIADGDNTVLTSSSNLPGVEQITITSNHANLPNAATSQIFNKLGISYTPSTLAGAPDKVMVAWVASPVTLTVKDSLGNEVGQSLVDPISDMKWVFVENPTGNYKIALTGTGSGDYHIGVDYYTESKTENVIKQGTAKSGVNLDYNLNFDPQAPQPLQLEPVDKIPPVTTVQLGGTTGNNDWYLSNVDVSLSASDNEGGTGIEKIEYSLDNALWQIYTQPLNINTEGTTTIYYYSSDFVGNKEEVKKVDIKIDKTPPEATLVFNPDLKEIEIKGEDNQSGIDNITENDGLITITDKAGHSLRLWIKEKEKPHPDKISIESLSYDKQPPINLEENRLRVEFSWDKKDNILRELQQEARIKGDIKMTAHYNQKKNQTGITIKEDGAEKQKININDLVLLKLITNKGNLEVIY